MTWDELIFKLCGLAPEERKQKAIIYDRDAVEYQEIEEISRTEKTRQPFLIGYSIVAKRWEL